jgi:hypothetical protein
MRHGPSRRPSLLAALVLLVAAAVARPAAAQTSLTGAAGTTGTTTTASLADGDIFVGIQQTEGANLSNFYLARFFNQAACQCKTPVFLYFTLTSTGFAKRASVPEGTLSFWVGSSCNDPILQKTNCQFLKSEMISTFMNLGRDTIPTTADVISANTTIATTSIDSGVVTGGTMPNVDCTSPVNGFNQTIWAIFDYGSDGTFDYSATQAVFVDLVPPPTPTGIVVAPANEALNVTWTDVDYTVNMDLQGYQVFCQRANGLQVFPNNTFGSAVMSCAATSGPGLTGLDPLFACSPLLNRTATSYRVKVLQNDIYYAATVVAIDNSGNAIPPTLTGCMPQLQVDPNCSFQKPERTLSFWDVYRDGNMTNAGPGQTANPGAATGGFCAVAGEKHHGLPVGLGAGGGAFVVLAAALARARRRRR